MMTAPEHAALGVGGRKRFTGVALRDSGLGGAPSAATTVAQEVAKPIGEYEMAEEYSSGAAGGSGDVAESSGDVAGSSGDVAESSGGGASVFGSARMRVSQAAAAAATGEAPLGLCAAGKRNDASSSSPGTIFSFKSDAGDGMHTQFRRAGVDKLTYEEAVQANEAAKAALASATELPPTPSPRARSPGLSTPEGLSPARSKEADVSTPFSAAAATPDITADSGRAGAGSPVNLLNQVRAYVART